MNNSDYLSKNKDITERIHIKHKYTINIFTNKGILAFEGVAIIVIYDKSIADFNYLGNQVQNEKI